MKNTLSISLALMLAASPSWAKPGTGHGHNGHSSQIGFVAVLGNNKSITVVEHGRVNGLDVTVDGNYDVVTVDQFGKVNSFAAMVFGNDDTVSIGQIGFSNTSNISQYGNYNSAFVGQLGHDNVSAIAQAADPPAPAISPQSVSVNNAGASYCAGPRWTCR
jgi:hypothetical protein